MCVLIVDIFPLKLSVIVQVTLLGMQGSSIFFDVLSVGSLAVVKQQLLLTELKSVLEQAS